MFSQHYEDTLQNKDYAGKAVLAEMKCLTKIKRFCLLP